MASNVSLRAAGGNPAGFLCVLGGLARDYTGPEWARMLWLSRSWMRRTACIPRSAPGLLESVYEAALAYELEKRGLRITRQQAIPVVYESVRIHTGFHADLVVEESVIVEIKALESIAPVHKKQLLTYLKLADKRLGLLINFNVALIKDGITRIVNGLKD